MGRTIEPPIPSARMLSELLEAPIASRSELMEEFARLHDTVYINVARSLLRQYGLADRADVEDAAQVVRMVAWQLVEDHLSGEKALPATIGSWPGFVRAACRREMEKFAATHSDRTLAMSDSKRRRLARFSATRTRLLGETGRDPSPQEVIDAANAGLAGRKDPEKSANMVLTLADANWDQGGVRQLQPELGDDDTARAVTPQPAATEAAEADRWYLLAPGEAPHFVARVYDRLRKQHTSQAGRVANTLLKPAIQEVTTEEGHDRGQGVIPTNGEVARAEDVPIEFVEEVRSLITQTAVRILVQDAKSNPEFRARLLDFARREGIERIA